MLGLNVYPGTWSVLGVKLPDFGLTEYLRLAAGKRPSAEVETRYNNPEVIRAWFGSTAPKQGTTTTVTPQQTSFTTTPVVTQTRTSQPQPQPQPQPRGYSQGDYRGYNVGDEVWVNGRLMRVVDPARGILELSANDPIERQQREIRARITSAIESTYGGIIQDLDRLAGLSEEWQREDERFLEERIGKQREALGQQKETSLANLGIARQAVEQNVASSTADIARSLRNLLQASQQRIGLMGAGASSASQTMLPYALGKEAARAGSEVYKGAVQQFNAIEMKKNDVVNTYNLALNKLEENKIAALQDIYNNYRNIKLQIEAEKRNANARKMEALNALDVNLLNDLRNKASMIEANAMQMQNTVRAWALNRLEALENYRIQMGQSGQYTPEELRYQQLAGLGEVGLQTGLPDYSYYYPIQALKKRQELLGL